MAVMIKCKMCGGDLALTEGSTIAECEYCGTVQTVPTMDDDKKLAQFERAERLRKNCEFDKAAGVYESIVADFRQEAEAYWGLVLCKYGIEYVDDPATGKKVPTCHRSSFESIMEDPNFDQALENADVAARKVYREEAKQIEEIRKGIIEVSNKEDPYDIFICYKETAEDGQRTLDSVLAQDVYDELTEKGYRVFFSRITLEDKLGQEYEPYIFAALNSAKVMLAVGTDYEYYNAVWVRNEWSRFLKLMEKDKEKFLIPCYKGIDAYDMPKEFARLQAQDLGKMGAVQDILRNMEKYIPRNGSTVQVVQKNAGLGDQLTELLDKAYGAMEREEWEAADELFLDALNASAHTSERFLIEQNVKQAQEQVRFQLRRKKCMKHNRYLTLILAVLMAIPFIWGGDIISDYIKGHADWFSFDEISVDTCRMIGLGLHVAFSGFMILATLLAARFVGKTANAKTGWVGTARVLAIIGTILSGLVCTLFYWVITDTGLTPSEMENSWPVFNWIVSISITHIISFIGLFFRRKV